MNARVTQEVLEIPLAALAGAGVLAPAAEPGTYVVRRLAAGAVAVEAGGAPVYVVLTPAAWQQNQAAQRAWRGLFRWAAEHLDTLTLRQMTAAAERLLAGRSAPCPQP